MELRKYQKQAIQELLSPDKKICFAECGVGKSAISLHWASQTNKKRWLIITTPSARESKQWINEYVSWFGSPPESQLEAFDVISWAGLAKWVNAHWGELDQYAIIADEVAKCKGACKLNGGSLQGKAFLQLTKRNPCWTGYTATPGDTWDDFATYFVASGLVKNKTTFYSEYADVQRYKGYPEIREYRHTDKLEEMWAQIRVCPDTSQIKKELPPEIHKQYHFKMPEYYKKFLKTHTTLEGDFIETVGGFCSYARQLCFSKEKQTWIKDYLSTLDKGVVMFYNFTKTGDELERIAKQSLPKNAKVWRIYGGAHDIPTKETIGFRDVVLCQWQAGSEALNLQFLGEWVSVEPHYSYSVSKQARGRIQRLGQEHAHLRYHYLRCDKTIEDSIYTCLKDKGEFAEDVWLEKNNIKIGEK